MTIKVIQIAEYEERLRNLNLAWSLLAIRKVVHPAMNKVICGVANLQIFQEAEIIWALKTQHSMN